MFSPGASQEGFTCMLEETCRQHFSSIADLTKHTREHKELMRRRLVCTYDVTRVAVCG